MTSKQYTENHQITAYKITHLWDSYNYNHTQAHTVIYNISRITQENYGATLSGLAMSAPAFLVVSRCQVSRFQSTH